MPNPNTLPADFFSKKQTANPDTLPADFNFSGSSSSLAPTDLPGSTQLLRDSISKLSSNPAVQANAQPTQFENDRNPKNQQGYSRGLPEFLGIIKGAAGMIGNMLTPGTPSIDLRDPYGPSPVVQQVTDVIKQDKVRKASGRSGLYRAVAAAGTPFANAAGMEKAAETGDWKGILGIAGADAAPALAPVIAEGALKTGIPQKLASPLEPMVNRIRAPLGDTAIKPRGTVPAESATPQELKDYADANNIPLNAAQATEHNLPRNIQSAGERATVAGTAVKNQVKAAQAGLAQHVDTMMSKLSPGATDLATAGDTIKSKVQSALDQQKSIADQNFSNLDKASNGTSVDMNPVIDETKNLMGKHGFVNAVAPQMGPKRAIGIVKSIQDIPERINFQQAQQLRSALLDESRHPDNIMSTEGQGIIKRLTGLIDGQMEQAAKSSPNPQLQSQFRDANAHYKGLQEDFNNPRSSLSQILQEPDPSKVPQKLTSKGQIGGSPFNAELMDKYGIDKGALKGVILQDLASKDFKLNNSKNLGGYSDAFLNSIFTPAELAEVYKTGAIARSVGMNSNPSGTSTVHGAMEDVQKPVRSLAPKAAAAKLTVSPRFNEMLMKATSQLAPVSSKIPSFLKMLTASQVAASAGQMNRKDK